MEVEYECKCEIFCFLIALIAFQQRNAGSFKGLINLFFLLFFNRFSIYCKLRSDCFNEISGAELHYRIKTSGVCLHTFVSNFVRSFRNSEITRA